MTFSRNILKRTRMESAPFDSRRRWVPKSLVSRRTRYRHRIGQIGCGRAARTEAMQDSCNQEIRIFTECSPHMIEAARDRRAPHVLLSSEDNSDALLINQSIVVGRVTRHLGGSTWSTNAGMQSFFWMTESARVLQRALGLESWAP